MNPVYKLWGREPALWLAFISSGIMLISAFAYNLTIDEQGGLNAICAATFGLLTAWAVARDGLQAAILGFMKAAIALAISWGWGATPENQALIMAFAAAASAMFVRTQATAPVSPEGAARSSDNVLRSSALVPVLMLLLIFGKCSGGGVSLALLRSALSSAPVLVNSLVASHVIPQAVADGDIADFTRASSIALTLAQDLKDAHTPLEKARAAHRAADGWRAVLEVRRDRDMGEHTAAQIQTVFSTANGIFLFIEAFYADKSGETPRTGAPAVDGLSESEFNEQLEIKLRKLEELVKQK